MPRLPVLSGAEIIKALTKKAGFKASHKSDKHVTLRKETDDGPHIVIVPLAKEIGRHLLSSCIIPQSGLSRDEFLKLFKK